MKQSIEQETKLLKWGTITWAIIFILSLCLLCVSSHAQRWSDTNRGLYPQSISATYNAHNTALGITYSYLPQLDIPIGFYTSFSNTINPNLDYNNYEWERKYSIGGIITLPHNLADGTIHTMLTLGLIYNEHPALYIDNDMLYKTKPIGCDLGVRVQIRHFTSSFKVDVANWFRYVEIGFGYCFSFYKG